MIVPNSRMIVTQMIRVIITPVLTLALLVVAVVLLVGWCRIRVVVRLVVVLGARVVVACLGRYWLAVCAPANPSQVAVVTVGQRTCGACPGSQSLGPLMAYLGGS